MVNVHAWVENICVILSWVTPPLVQNDNLDKQMVLHRDHLEKNTIQLARSVRDQWVKGLIKHISFISPSKREQSLPLPSPLFLPLHPPPHHPPLPPSPMAMWGGKQYLLYYRTPRDICLLSMQRSSRRWNRYTHVQYVHTPTADTLGLR